MPQAQPGQVSWLWKWAGSGKQEELVANRWWLSKEPDFCVPCVFKCCVRRRPAQTLQCATWHLSSQPGWTQGKILKGNEKHLKVSGGCSQWHRAPVVLVQVWPLARLSCLLLLWPLPALGRVVARFPLFWHGWILSVIPHAKYKAVWFCLHVYQCCVVLALFYWCIDLRQKGVDEVHFKSCTINCLTSCMLSCSYLPYCVRLTASGRDGFDMCKYRVNGSKTVLQLRARVHSHFQELYSPRQGAATGDNNILQNDASESLIQGK